MVCRIGNLNNYCKGLLIDRKLVLRYYIIYEVCESYNVFVNGFNFLILIKYIEVMIKIIVFLCKKIKYCI